MNSKANGWYDYDAKGFLNNTFLYLCAPVYHRFYLDAYVILLLSDVCVTGVRPPCEELGVLPKPSCEFEG